MRLYTAALVGLGNIAWQFDRFVPSGPVLTHAGAYQKNEQTMLRGGFSPDCRDRSAFEEKLQLPAYSSFEEMMTRLKPQIVSICSPVECHFDQVEYCLKHEIPMIWLEKPPVATTHELDRLLKLQKENGGKSKILINYQRRYMECYQRLGQLFNEKFLGECQHIHITYSRELETNGSHLLDYLFYILNEDVKYSIDWVSSLKDHKNPSFGLRFGDLLRVFVCGIDLSYHCIDISLLCEQGRASILHGGMTPVLEVKTEHENFPSFYRLSTSGHDLLGRGGFEGSFEAVLEDLITAYEKGCEPRSNLRTARATQSLVETMEQLIRG
jgi:predicted dehydrogenase